VRITVRLQMVSTVSAAQNELRLELPETATVESALSELGLLSQESNLLMLIDGCGVDSRHPLEDGDVLVVLPRLAGG